MQVAVRRPHFATGVALVGASVIAASAVTPIPDIHLPEIQLPSIHVADVRLAALANPLDTYAQVFHTALAGANTLIENTVPGQLLAQLLANQLSSGATLLNGLASTAGGVAAATAQIPAELSTAVGQLAAGDVEGAVNTLLGLPLSVAAPILGLLPVLQTVLTKPLTNLVNVINAFTRDPQLTLLAVSGFIAPLISAPAAAAAAIQNVINAVGTGDLGAVANAVLTAPATIVDGLLNGGYGPDLGPLAGFPAGSGLVVKAGGLLSSSALTVDENGNVVVTTGGPFYALQQVLKMITDAITPPAAAPVVATATIASLPAAAATTVTLTTASTPEKTPAVTDTVTDATAAKPASDATTEKPTSSDDTSTDAASGTPAAAIEPDESTSTTNDLTTKDSTTEDSTTDDSTTKDASDASSPVKKPTSSDTDVKTGNKVDPKSPTGSQSTNSGGTSTATAGKDGAATNPSTSSANGSEKGTGKSTPKSASS
ncbi:hypothetical protein [Mycolicibacterium hodleri]|uniref:PE-PGRS family protein n=1 Tax=Mycolicibacterium hodleri TaxID=49897 RepID=A0A502ED04_9MYCO|nr:hypothetical protein [Mycolicibacterium hodleri]TPG34889.1 hypothetical protein EAH80_08640 [Mycolicibacterium hodleri]